MNTLARLVREMSEKPVITYLGQSGFLLEYNDSRLLIDPSNKKSGDLDGNIIFCTHNHFDHIGGVEVFLNRNPSAILVCNEQTAGKFTHHGERVKIVKGGDSFTYEPWDFQFTNLRHGFFKGVQNTGAVILIGEFSFAHCGDAVEFTDYPNQPVSMFAVPISGAFAANPGKVLKMVSNLDEPRPIIVPMHWLFRSPSRFCKKLHGKIPNIKCSIPVVGETLDL